MVVWGRDFPEVSMCTDNCGWTVTPAKPQHPNLEPAFDPTFESHMRGTVSDTGALTGCHTLYGRGPGDRQFEQEGDHDHKVFAPSTKDKIYSAKVQLKTGEDVRGRAQFSNEKLSSFWPDDMCLECVKQAIIYAWKNYKGAESNAVKHKGQYDEMQREMKDTPVKWAGKVAITKGNASFRTWVGSPQTGGQSSKILSAYPKVKAKFF